MRQSSKKRKNKEKIKFSKIIVAGIILSNIIFVIAVLWIFLTLGVEPVATITAWFAFTTGELWALSGIKKKETTDCLLNPPTPMVSEDITPTGEGLIE